MRIFKKVSLTLPIIYVAIFGFCALQPSVANAQRSHLGKYIPRFKYMTSEQKKKAIKEAEKRLIEYRHTHYIKHVEKKLEKLPSDFICTGINEVFKGGTIERTFRDPCGRKYDKDETFHVIMRAEGKKPGDWGGYDLYYLGQENDSKVFKKKVTEKDLVHSGKVKFTVPTQIEYFEPIKGLKIGVYRLGYWSGDNRGRSYHAIYIRELKEPNPYFFTIPK